jgi:hypothetical protein
MRMVFNAWVNAQWNSRWQQRAVDLEGEESVSVLGEPHVVRQPLSSFLGRPIVDLQSNTTMHGQHVVQYLHTSHEYQ